MIFNQGDKLGGSLGIDLCPTIFLFIHNKSYPLPYRLITGYI